MKDLAWIGLDWGTTNLRAYAFNSTDAVVAELTSENGMNKLKPDEFEKALLSLIGDWLKDDRPIPVIACGMVGARQGWKEVAYQSVHCIPALAPRSMKVQSVDPRIDVHILPGLSQCSPPDVMRGEETQIAGFLQIDPHYSGSICLPGTHSKWVKINDGKVISFKTFLTGELFSLLAQKSVLRHSISDGATDETAFKKAANEAAKNPAQVPGRLFGIRAMSLLSEQDPVSAWSSLSGLVIGQEIGVAKDFWSNKKIVLIGSDEFTSLYGKVFSDLGVASHSLPSHDAVISGLKLAARARFQTKA